MENLIAQVKSIFLPLFGSFFIIFIAGFMAWLKKINDQKKRNAFNEIDLAVQKISFDTQHKPIDDLVSESNKSHGATVMGDSTGVDPKKK